MQRTESGVDAKVRVENSVVEVALQDGRLESVERFADLDDAARQQLAVEVWSVGLRAFQNAFAQAEAAQLRDVGKSLLEDVEKQLERHTKDQEAKMQTVLRAYFNPEDGQVTQRLKRFVDDDGELARVLRQHIAPEDSTLAKTLAQRVGEQSPLFRRLDPEDSEGLVKQLEVKIAETIQQGQDGFAKALDPAAEDSPIARFLRQLRERLNEDREDQQKQLKTVTEAIDANNEDSLLNRMLRQTETTQKQLVSAMDPSNEDSPLGKIQRTLGKMIEKHMEDNKELLHEADKRQQDFEKEIREAIARFEQSRKEAERTTFGGLEFEDAAFAFIHDALEGGPYIVEATGNTPGLIRNSKIGDVVVRFAGEHAFAGSGLVVEVKRSSAYTTAQALEEIETARKNRDCQAGVFIMARGSAPKGFPRFARYGSDILLTWDREDPETNPYLHAGILAGLALVTRRQKVGDEGDIEALRGIEKDIRHEVKRLSEMETWTSNIHRDAGKIDEQIRIAKKKLNSLIDNTNQTLKALDIEVEEEEEERGSPITAPNGSFERAVDALGDEDAGRDRTTYDEANGPPVDDDDVIRVDLTGEDTDRWESHMRASSTQPDPIAAYRARRDEEADDDEDDESVDDAEDDDYEEL